MAKMTKTWLKFVTETSQNL